MMYVIRSILIFDYIFNFVVIIDDKINELTKSISNLKYIFVLPHEKWRLRPNRHHNI